MTASAGAVQVIAIVREVFVAAQVGLSSSYDAFLIALILPTTFAAILTAGTMTAFVPAYLEVRSARGLAEARRLAGAICFWVGLAGVAGWLLLETVGSVAIAIAGPGLDALGRQAAVSHLHVLAPLGFVSAVTAIVFAICQAEERFKVIAMANIVGGVATLTVTLVLWQPLALQALALANLVGPVSSATILAAAAIRGSYAPRPTLWTTRTELSAFVRHAAPLTLSSAILQVNGIVDRAIASLIGPGAVSALRYADVLVRTPVGAISPAWSTTLYPWLVRVAQAGPSGLGIATSRALRYSLVAAVPIAALTIAVAPIAVWVGFGRGAFTDADVARTAAAVAAFAPIIVFTMCVPALTGALNARRRGGVLLAGGALNVALNFVFDVVLGLTFGAAGVALSSSLTAMVVLIFFVRRLARSEEDFAPAPIVRTLTLAVAASLPVAVPVGLVAWLEVVPMDLGLGLLALSFSGLFGVVGYAVIATRIGLEEARVISGLVATRWLRRGGGADTPA